MGFLLLHEARGKEQVMGWKTLSPCQHGITEYSVFKDELSVALQSANSPTVLIGSPFPLISKEEKQISLGITMTSKLYSNKKAGMIWSMISVESKLGDSCNRLPFFVRQCRRGIYSKCSSLRKPDINSTMRSFPAVRFLI